MEVSMHLTTHQKKFWDHQFSSGNVWISRHHITCIARNIAVFCVSEADDLLDPGHRSFPVFIRLLGEERGSD
jgi:hypothetical protein